MAFKFKAGPSQPVPAEIKLAVREAIAQNHEDDKIILRKLPPDYIEPPVTVDSQDLSITNDDRKMERLVADDFPFDDSQLFAINGLVESQYGCLTGAAGTGKTTCTKKLVDRLMESTPVGSVDMRQYWAKDLDDRATTYNDSDDYKLDEKNPVIPTIMMCAFTGRASQQIKKNFPQSWHGNIMTIHRALGFVPETYEDWDPEWIDKNTGIKGSYRTKMRFVPTYTADCLMPWDIILVDEAGMLGLDLWHQLLAAVKPGARVYLIGDINQLPPVHGKSIFGFAMARWPAYELTHVHRQAGKDNPIVDNAWRVIHGLMPVSEGNFQMIPLKGDAAYASRQVRAMVPKLKERGIYDPIRDTIITPINAHEPSARGYQLGQVPLNQEFALIFNPDQTLHPRFIIDGGRERKKFAVGDKVMATVNDWEAGITNGMTGIITSITEHQGYAGDRMRFGEVNEVNARYAEGYDDDEIGLVDLDSLENSFAAIDEGRKQAKDKRERGPSSHIVEVRFGSEEHGFLVPFDTLAKVGSLMTAYVVTCHKMQGGEAPAIIIIVHDSHKAMLYREWLYTAITRASERCIVLYTEGALRTTLNKQTIKGRTLKQKIESFNTLMDPNNKFDWSKEVRLPTALFSGPMILDREDHEFTIPERLITEKDRQGGVMQLVAQKKNMNFGRSEAEPSMSLRTKEPVTESTPTPSTPTPVVESVTHIRVTTTIKVTNIQAPTIQALSPKFRAPPVPDTSRVIDGGDLRSERSEQVPTTTIAQEPRVNGAIAHTRYVSQWGAIRLMKELEGSGQKLLTHQPTQIELPTPPAPKLSGLAFLASLKQKGVMS